MPPQPRRGDDLVACPPRAHRVRERAQHLGARALVDVPRDLAVAQEVGQRARPAPHAHALEEAADEAVDLRGVGAAARDAALRARGGAREVLREARAADGVQVVADDERLVRVVRERREDGEADAAAKLFVLPGGVVHG